MNGNSQYSRQRTAWVGAAACLVALSAVGACLGWGVPYEEGQLGCQQNSDCTSGFVCVGRRCVGVCSRDEDCGGNGAICVDSTCRRPLPGACTDEFDCIFPAPCEQVEGAACTNDRCAYPLLAEGTGCDDGNLCTDLDECDAAGECIGVAIVCDAPPANHCDANELTTYPGIGACDRVSGECIYRGVTTTCDPCSDCLAECDGVVCPPEAGGCQVEGVCVGGAPPECQYANADDSTACDLPNDPAGSLRGVCSAGACVGCIDASHCTDIPQGEAQCWDIACNSGVCEYTVRNGQGCDDGELCTHTDVCDATGVCGGTAITCNDDPGSCGIQRSCDGTSQCVEVQATVGSSCDDGEACTYDDTCNGSGVCVGTSITCSDAAGTCAVNRSCNGTSSCRETYPGTGTSCNDGNACTYGDHCNGSGTCVGTSITCNDSAGTCAANRSCNGTSSCDVTYPGSGTSCNDNNACTYNDRCNGSGSCTGTSITCNNDSGICGANRACNGTSSCDVAYPGSGTGCNDGNACTTGDHCNGAGSCVGGGNAADGTSCGGTWQACCGGVCRNLTSSSYCGGCAVNCASQGMSCRATNGGYACGACSATSTCRLIYDSNATCWCSTCSPPGYDNCQCQCPNGETTCPNAGCGVGMTCHDVVGDNYCAPF